ncbi:MAG: RNA-directed DNA polymerase [Lentilactobacillus buchneri]|nr:RNA-directed DNA polymerase [Lentilactobacillus buchneri]MCI1951068.1 RNA-directed DNA polymerase [Lentilactobacillus buchneri]MCI2019505.1 RNA-directed DNA polymerase [Lentilactobacillus buchneri]MCI2028569.1 RNA-directed DNA polymerase [Lentilactobacillus buchneri]
MESSNYRNESRKSVLEMSATEARNFFLKPSTYAPMQLPEYFDFSDVLKQAERKLESTDLEGLSKKKSSLSKEESVNYQILMNKNGQYDWRPVQIVHPITYINLVNVLISGWDEIIKRFQEFRSDSRIKCISIPVESQGKKSDTAETILNWWESLEQASIVNGLKYKYCIKTDVTNCYGSIYTHTIPWAMMGKSNAKDDKKNGLGNLIDKTIEYMQNGQTNGIPQGGPLFDFIAEIVLGYSDLILSKTLQSEIKDFTVIRYRDDYRIFSNSKEEAEKVVKKLSEVLADLNMHFNAKKTGISTDLIGMAIKQDKKFWMKSEPIIFTKAKGSAIQYHLSLQKHLLQIYELSSKFPNSGSIKKALFDFLVRLSSSAEKFQNDQRQQLISIVVSIMLQSPNAIPLEVAVLSNIFSKIEDKSEIPFFIDAILKKFEDVPNTGYVEIWLQRLSIFTDRNRRYSEILCQKIYSSKHIWNSDWLKEDFAESSIVNTEIIDKLKLVVPNDEVDVFKNQYNLPSF